MTKSKSSLNSFKTILKDTAYNYCKALAVALAIFFSLDILDTVIFTINISDSIIHNVYGISFVVSYITFSIISTSCEIGFITAPNQSKSICIGWIDIVSIILSAFLFIFIYFTFSEFSPFFIIYTILGNNLGFAVTIIIIALSRILGKLFYGKLGKGTNPITFKERMSLLALGMIIFLILFAPMSEGALPRNLALLFLIIVSVILVFLFRLIKRILTISIIANKLRSRKAKDIHCNYFASNRQNNITYTLGGRKHNIKILFNVSKKTRYYFEDSSLIRRYVALSSSAKHGRARASISSTIQWIEISPQKLPWNTINDNEDYILLFKKMPMETADADSRDRTLGTNDLAAKRIKLNTLKYFIDSI